MIDQDRTPHGRLSDFQSVRALSEQICEPLAVEDYGLQARVETSPLKWHLAHTTWFFETFVLKPFMPGYTPFHPGYEQLFNSYYNSLGNPYPRGQRHLLSRPTVAEVYDYRHTIDRQVLDLLDSSHCPPEALARIELGLHHEQQHQELMLTDLKYNLAQNPLWPCYREARHTPSETSGLRFLSQPGGVLWIGHDPAQGFAFDNEGPRHQVLVQPFALASRLITNGEYLEFIQDGGYFRPELWLADGWNQSLSQNWQHPLYWQRQGAQWLEFTLHGLQPLSPELPVTHISYYEADAFARWCGARLCTEFEWESVASQTAISRQGLDFAWLHPTAATAPATLHPLQLFGTTWQWTQSAYLPYPGYRATSGALGEYNGKFMCNQQVLRGSSCATPPGHSRASYRNFFYPHDRWQFTGIRLARDL